MTSDTKLKEPVLDRLVGYFSPRWAAQRAAGRAWKMYYDRTGDEMRRLGLKSSYRGGVPTRVDDDYGRSFSFTGIRHLAGKNARNLRDRARNLVRNNILASALLNASASFVIGSGTRIEPATSDIEFNKRASELWEGWWSGRNGQSPDVRGLCNGPELERLLFIARLRDGDSGVILLDDGRLQPIEGDLIETPDKMSGRFDVAEGVSLNAIGRPTGFWIRTIAQDKPLNRKWQLVPAEDFVYLPRVKRLNQVRGESVFAQSFGLFEQMDGYVEAVVLAARMAALFGLLIREGTQGFTGLPTTKDSRGTDRPTLDLEPAMVKWIGPTDEVVQVKPEQPTTSFEQFLIALTRMSGLELSLPLEVSMLDFSRTNYSSARAALIVAQRAAGAEHQNWSCRSISRIYRWRISKWINNNELNPPSDGVPWKHRALQQPHDYLDPVKEVMGDMMAVDAGFSTLSEMLIGRGMTLDDYIADRSRELQKLSEAGIVLSKARGTRDTTTEQDDDKDIEIEEEAD